MTYTPAQLKERTLHRRAIEAAIWGIPAVNYDAMYQALVRDAKGASNQIVYWSRLLDWKNQTLTPNPDAIYLMPFYDTTDGPVVLEIPPADEGSISGSIDDAWQAALADVGPAGIDAGKWLSSSDRAPMGRADHRRPSSEGTAASRPRV